MMLDTHAADLHKAELPEVLERLPHFENKRVLELGAGIGRFTGELARVASHVTAVDFMKSFIEANEQTNGPKFSNIKFLQADVTVLDFPEGSFDFVFSNWLMMYLTDAEVDGTLSIVTLMSHLFNSDVFQSSSGRQNPQVADTPRPSLLPRVVPSAVWRC